VRRVAPGADDIDQVLAVRHVDLGGELAHHLRGRRDLADRLFLDAQPDRQGGDHHGRDFAAHDLPHQRQHLVVKDFAMLDRALQSILESDRHDRQSLLELEIAHAAARDVDAAADQPLVGAGSARIHGLHEVALVFAVFGEGPHRLGQCRGGTRAAGGVSLAGACAGGLTLFSAVYAPFSASAGTRHRRVVALHHALAGCAGIRHGGDGRPRARRRYVLWFLPALQKGQAIDAVLGQDRRMETAALDR
jgi:hypothetical protein